jgi:hypothetical protein
MEFVFMVNVVMGFAGWIRVLHIHIRGVGGFL